MPRKKKQLTLPHVPVPMKTEDGNPLVAFRAPVALIRRYVKKHGSRRAANAALRRHMETSTRGGDK